MRAALEQEELKQLALEEEERQRRRRQKSLSRTVSGRAMANDRTRELEATARLNIRQRKVRCAVLSAYRHMLMDERLRVRRHATR